MTANPESPLASMSVLLGDWTMESPQFPRFRGRALFEWIENGAYLAVRDDVDEGEVPSGAWIVGGDDSSEECAALYHDSRGVRRVYHMSLVSGEWKIWRNAPGFNQRFSGKVATDGGTITGRWETSHDGPAKTMDRIADMGYVWSAWIIDPSRNALGIVQPKDPGAATAGPAAERS